MLIQIKNIKMENTTNLKQITFKELKHISDSNFEKYNRNVNVKNLKKFYGFHNQHKMIVEKLMEHNHFMGEPIESQVRCFIYTTKDNVTKEKENRVCGNYILYKINNLNRTHYPFYYFDIYGI